MSTPAENAALTRLAEAATALHDLAEPGSKLESALCEFSCALIGVLCPPREAGEFASAPATQLHEVPHG